MKVLATLAFAILVPLAFVSSAASSAPVTVPLLTASPFALLSAAGISDVPTSTVNGDVGVSPTTGASITGLTCAEVTGRISTVDAGGPLPCRVADPGMLTTATTDLTAAYVNAAGRTPDSTLAGADNQLGGLTLDPGVYRIDHATTANLAGNVTLHGNADAVWIFQASSDLVIAGSSTVTLTGGAQSCNVFWQVGSSATLHSSSTVRGTFLVNTSISVDSGVTVDGATSRRRTNRLGRDHVDQRHDHQTVVLRDAGVDRLRGGGSSPSGCSDTGGGSSSSSSSGAGGRRRRRPRRIRQLQPQPSLPRRLRQRPKQQQTQRRRQYKQPQPKPRPLLRREPRPPSGTRPKPGRSGRSSPPSGPPAPTPGSQAELDRRPEASGRRVRATCSPCAASPSSPDLLYWPFCRPARPLLRRPSSRRRSSSRSLPIMKCTSGRPRRRAPSR